MQVQLGPDASFPMLFVELFDVIVVEGEDDDSEILATPDINNDDIITTVTVIRTVNVASNASVYSQLVSSSLKYDLILLFVLLI